MDLFLNPNVAYLLLVIGLVMAILALFAPGTGLLETGALFAIVLAGYAIYNLPINAWALVVLALGIFPFLLALRKSRQYIYLALSLVALVIGSVFLFRQPDGQPAIHPALAVITSITAVGMLWLMARKGLEAMHRKPAQDLGRLVGMTGKAHTDIAAEGSAYVAGEEWSARSKTRIPAGSAVRVIAREGLVLQVELIPPANSD